MSSLTVRRLHLSAGRERQWSARLAIERALGHCELAPGRLLLVKRGPSLALAARGGTSLADIEPSLALEKQFLDGMEPIAARAVHGANSAAQRADAVWFRDRSEALACYIALLACGHKPGAWFWALALPRECPAQSPAAVLRKIAASLQAGGEAAVRAAKMLAHAFSLAPPVEVLRLLAQPGVCPAMSVAELPTVSVPRLPPNHAQTDKQATIALAQRLSLQTMLRRNPHGRAFAQVLGTSPAPEAILTVLAVLHAQTRPDRAAIASVHRERVSEWWQDHELASQLASGDAVLGAGQHREASDASPVQRRHHDAPAVGEAVQTETPQAEVEECTAADKVEDHIREDPSPDAEAGLASAELPGGGLLLAIPALVRLGFAEWMAARPALLARDGARGFLLHLFAHYAPNGLRRASLLLTGDPRLPYGPPTPAEHAFRELWRHALDGWLRRSAQCRLHDLARREAYHHEGVERQIVAFPIKAIHLGLRRHALDVDPGWIPWLGVSLRYTFSQNPRSPEGAA